jgi:hypothetical protein
MNYRSFAGILLVLSFVFTVVAAYDALIVDEIWEFATDGGDFAGIGMLVVYGTFITLGLGIVALAGGVSALTGKSFALSIVGVACGLISGGWYYMGTVCAVAALPVLILARHEFEGEERPMYVPYGEDGLPPDAMPPPPSVEEAPDMHLPSGRTRPHPLRPPQQRRPPS